MPNACGMTVTSVPLIGAYALPSDGTMATPCPIAPDENTLSGTWESGTT